MNGVTGRMGTNQHYLRSLLAIRQQGGVRISDSATIMPELVLVGRSEAKLAALAAMGEGIRSTTDLGAALVGGLIGVSMVLWIAWLYTPRREGNVEPPEAERKSN